MDVDLFVARHAGEWARLEALVRRARRPSRMSGEETDELVALYQRTATHLSLLQTRSRDPALVARLSTLVSTARTSVTGAGGAGALADLGRFLRVVFPAAVHRSRWWWLGVTVAFLVVATAVGAWVVTQPSVQASLGTTDEIRQLCTRDFEDYYSSAPASSFASRVWTNNALIAAAALVSGVLLGLPTLYVLWSNAVSIGATGGIMVSCGESAQFFGLITPHGLMELSAVFLAGAVGLRLGWTVVDPGRRSRGQALAEEGRAAVTVALGLVIVLAVSGVIEAFVTPSPLPTWARIAIGVVGEVGFLWWTLVLGGRAVRAGEIGDLELGQRSDAALVT